MQTYSRTISSGTYCVIIFKKLDYHLWFGLILLMIFSSYSPVIRTHRMIPFPLNKIIVNPRERNLKIKFKIHLSNKEVRFLHVTVSL